MEVQRGGADPRVQQRTYLFTDSNEQMPYALFVSSKVSKDKKNPLIVTLHGLGGDQNTMVRESFKAVDLAEEGGYILVSPMGYNSGGWYGIPSVRRVAVGAGNGANGAAAPQRGAANGANRSRRPSARRRCWRRTRRSDCRRNRHHRRRRKCARRAKKM